MRVSIVFIFVLFALLSCGENSNNKQDSTANNSQDKQTETSEVVQKEKATTKCIYRLDEERTRINWKAYKTTEKIGVGGTFDNVEIFLGKKDTLSAIKDAIMGTSFIISPFSVNSGNKERDKKLVKYFFKSLGVISGKFVNVQDNGNGMVQLAWNGMEQLIPYIYQVKEDSLFINTKIHFSQWRLEKNAKALNKACKKLHSGKDGKSKLWPEVDVRTKVVFKKYCG